MSFYKKQIMEISKVTLGPILIEVYADKETKAEPDARLNLRNDRLDS